MSPLLKRRVGARSTLHGSLRYGLALGALLVSASACGGRWRTITTTPDDDSSDNGGAVGTAGAASSHAGTSTGQAGGTAAGGDSSGCGTVNCPNIACPDGSIPVTPTGQCCPVCQSVCMQVCPACAPGTQAQTHVGACCPDCVPTISCAAGQMSYQDSRTTVSYKFSFGCSSDSDCSVVSPVNKCESGCGAVAIVKSGVDSFTEYLKTEADSDCVACQVGPTPPCVPPGAAHCDAGQCEFQLPRAP